MTFSILARDPSTNAIGGAAATGSLCVGGWVLRGDPRAGVSASQGKSPSTLWGEDVLAEMRRGRGAVEAIRAVTAADRGRGQRQLSALGLAGPGAAFTGGENTPAMADLVFDGGVAAGNMLSGAGVVDAMVEAYRHATGPLPVRLLAALRGAEAAGSDVRGLLSAALLVVSPDHAPLTLRIDWDEDPLAALERLHERATTGDYAGWVRCVPTLADPERRCD